MRLILTKGGVMQNNVLSNEQLITIKELKSFFSIAIYMGITIVALLPDKITYLKDVATLQEMGFTKKDRSTFVR